ncbi:MAG: HAD family hydrolase [Rhizobiaceae bacterium]
MTTIRGILFDKDGTLIDFDATWATVARKMAMEAANGDAARADYLLDLSGLDLVAGKFRADSVFAAGTNAEVVALWHPDTTQDELPGLVARYDAITAREGAACAVALPGIREALSALHVAGYRLGVATNDSAVGAERTLAALGVSELFDVAYGYDSVERPKPAPDVVHAFAARVDLALAEIAFVGDNRHDLEAGRAAHAGLVIGVLSGTGRRETLAPLADVVLESVADLPDYLAEC